MTRTHDYAETLSIWLARLAPDLPPAQREHRFHATRRWRFDFAYPAQRLAVECDGGQFAPGGGRHNRDSDRVKLNAAAALGWRVLRFSGGQLCSDPHGCVKVLRAALAWQPETSKRV